VLLKRLYDLDVQGIHDIDLCDEVGTTLFARCQAYVLVSRGEVRCPRCGTVFQVARRGRTQCPADTCTWTTTHAIYRESIRNHYAFPGGAMEAFRSFCERYPRARSYQQKIVLIDWLVHSFHVSEKTGKITKSVASKLFEGNKKAVVRFLDALSAHDPAAKEQWRRDVVKTIDRRIVEDKLTR
jgi:hypothetical protein